MTTETQINLTKDEQDVLTAINKLRTRPTFSNIAEALGVPRSCETVLDSVLTSLVSKHAVYFSSEFSEYRAM